MKNILDSILRLLFKSSNFGFPTRKRLGQPKTIKLVKSFDLLFNSYPFVFVKCICETLIENVACWQFFSDRQEKLKKGREIGILQSCFPNA